MSAPAGIVTTADYHTAGEPFRIVTSGAPELVGETVVERRRWVASHADEVRRLLVHEPRGHADMYGCYVTPPDDDGADLGVIFFHNEGYSTACGHGTIALVTWAIETGYVQPRGSTAMDGGVELIVDVPSGRLACTARLDDAGRVTAVRFRNVPSFVLARDVGLDTRRGPVTLDVGFGGAFYGSLDVRTLGLAVEAAALPELIALQRELRPALERVLPVQHPSQPDLAGIYGIIFWEPLGDPRGAALGQRNVTVFADGEVDRSPCGSGTSARLALLHDEGLIQVGQRLHHRSIVDTAFDGWITAEATVARRPAVITEIEGSAYATGRHTFSRDVRDPLGNGFLLR